MNLLNAKDIPIDLNKKLMYLQHVGHKTPINQQINMKLST